MIRGKRKTNLTRPVRWSVHRCTRLRPGRLQALRLGAVYEHDDRRNNEPHACHRKR